MNRCRRILLRIARANGRLASWLVDKAAGCPRGLLEREAADRVMQFHRPYFDDGYEISARQVGEQMIDRATLLLNKPRAEGMSTAEIERWLNEGKTL